ncbi:hypothetical protein CDL15_Pgr028256 [Punica granatum]|uniref:Receptor-like serine/threonine-protein kinase n=1 Tax=Punica granatum TaxID=22663 RepID=A0A218WUY1_PUNGR|nr:hypothetical protein CDL15_Pgr028256 [Punica granatum]
MNGKQSLRFNIAMASPTLCSLLLVLFVSGAEAQQIKYSNISLGSSLSPATNSSWPSPSGIYAFGFYQQGQGYKVGVFLSGIQQRTIVWTAHRDDPPVPENTTLLLTTDGRLVLKSADGGETSIADPKESAFSASVTDSGNFLLRNPLGDIIWESFNNLTDTLLPGQRLSAGKELFSSMSATNPSTGIFRLKMQHDGNLIQYAVQTPDTGDYSYYNTGTFTSGDNVSLNFDQDGHLYLLNTKGFNIKNVTTGGYPSEDNLYRFTIDSDGLLRLYSYDLKQNKSWSVRWSSTNDKCDPKGLCGFNGFCDLNNQEAECRCLPGFDLVQRGNWTAGCGRNFTADDCKSERDGIITGNYVMKSVDSMQWEDDPYSVLELANKEACGKACLEDCNCEAALFTAGKCSKQRLPLRYGRIASNGPTSALIKVGAPSTDENGPTPREKTKEVRMDILIVSMLLACFGIILLALSGIIIHRNRLWEYRRIRSKVENCGFGELMAPRCFTLAELKTVTDNFKEELGRGAFGTVYEGMIWGSDKVVAVKRLDKYLAEGEKEFRTEVEVIGRTHHRNLVRLLGYCVDGPHRLLVYEYMSNGSLAGVLFSREKQPPPWNERMGIAQDIARGIHYLHEECESQIIHCDIKPQNILMDKGAKISDFGLAKLMGPDQTKTFTGIRGTRGYVAPEWHQKQPITAKADVYSFGVMLLEIICCRKNVDCNLPEKEAILEEWARDCFENGEVQKLVGDEVVDKRELESAVKIGLWCIVDDPTLRPSVKKVLLMLEGSLDVPIPLPLQPFL